MQGLTTRSPFSKSDLLVASGCPAEGRVSLHSTEMESLGCKSPNLYLNPSSLSENQDFGKPQGVIRNTVIEDVQNLAMSEHSCHLKTFMYVIYVSI